MPLPHAIDLHDSTLAALRREGDALVLELRPAYVHRDGAGWMQDADIRVSWAIVATMPAALPARIWGGTLEAVHAVSEHLLALPLDAGTPVRLVLEAMTGARLDVAGTAIRIALLGEPRFVECVD